MHITKATRREGPVRIWVRKMFLNIRSQLSWIDCVIGLSAAAVFALLMSGFRYQIIPPYKAGDIASRDIRASQDLNYEDTVATAQKRELARASVPAIYDLNTRLISTQETQITRAFEEARDLLARRHLPASGTLSPELQAEILSQLRRTLGGIFPPEVLQALLSHRFNTSLEGQLLKILDTILRDGIIKDADRAQFQKHQRIGILVRDDAAPLGTPLGEAYAVRTLSAAREYLRQFQLELATLPSVDRVVVLQYLESQLFPTLVYNETETEARREAAAAQVPAVEVHVKQGKIIVRSGEEITRNMVTQLEALRSLQRPKSLFRQSIGFFFFALTFIYALWRYFVHHQSRHRQMRSNCFLILLVLTSVLLVTRLITELADILGDRLSIDALGNHYLLDYAIPFAFGSLLVTLLIDTELGVFTSIICATLTGLFFNDVYLVAYVFLGSLAGIYSIRQYKDRAAIQKAGLTIGLVDTLCLLGIDLVRQMPFSYSGIATQAAIAFASGLLTAAVASLMLPALESLFKITTDIRLLELSNLNAPILRRLSVEAPGTYHHSLMVATLAEAAAEAIGANPLLARVGAYYHDLGKVLKPEYFVENQAFGMNKHENLSPSMSCLIIASHIKDGLELAREIGLAEKIRDLIPQHHGTRVMTYFFRKAKDSPENRNQDVEETDFRYPGPKPQSQEAAIMMMADSVEAASRTLTNPTPAQIQGLVNRLVDAIVADNQLDECDITMRDIHLIKESFVKVLSGLHHRRIDYPGYDFREIGTEAEKSTVQNSSPKQPSAVQDSQARRGPAVLKDTQRA